MVCQVYFSVFLSTDRAYGFLATSCFSSLMACCFSHCSFFYLCIARLTVGIPCISIFCTCCFLDISKFCFAFVVCWIYFSVFFSTDRAYCFLDAGCFASFMACCFNHCSFFYLCIAGLTVSIPCISIFCTCCFLDIPKFCFPFVVCWVYFSVFFSTDRAYCFLATGCFASFMAIYCTAIFFSLRRSFYSN